MTREEASKILEYPVRKWSMDWSDRDDGLCYTEALDMAIAALREQPRWISVEEALPTPFVSVLVYMPDERPLPTVHEGYVTRDGKWYAHYFDRNPGEVTHWMPLPEAPKEKL